MIVDAKKKFLTKAAESGNEQATIELYNLYKNEKGDGDFHSAGKLYIETLIKYSPPVAIKILMPEFDLQASSKQDIEYEYLEGIAVAARYNSAYEHYSNCALWAKKGLLLMNKFTEEMSINEAIRFQRRNSIKDTLKNLLSDTAEFLIEDELNKFTFEWERGYF